MDDWDPGPGPALVGLVPADGTPRARGAPGGYRPAMLLRRVFVVSLLPSLLTLGCNGSSEGGSGGTEDGSGGAGDSAGGTSSSDGGSVGLDPDVSSGCEATAVGIYPPGTTEGSITASRERTFRVHVPPSYEAGKPMPVVLMFHGGGGSAEQLQEASAQMDVIADREGFITIYPNGTGAFATWNGGICCGRAVQDEIDDVAFVGALLDHLEAEVCVDKKRIFSSGMSNGGIMSHRLGCELSERIAAIAPVAGTIGVTDCTPTRPVPVMHIHGTDDGYVPWNGGVACDLPVEPFISVPTTIDNWLTINGCDGTSSEAFTEGNGTCTAYDGCEAPVVLCTIEGGGHSWPGGEPNADILNCPEDGPQSETFSASEAAWQFFAENPRP